MPGTFLPYKAAILLFMLHNFSHFDLCNAPNIVFLIKKYLTKKKKNGIIVVYIKLHELERKI